MSWAVRTLLVLPYVNLLIEYASDWLRTLWRRSSPRRSSRKATPLELPEMAESAAG